MYESRLAATRWFRQRVEVRQPESQFLACAGKHGGTRIERDTSTRSSLMTVERSDREQCACWTEWRMRWWERFRWIDVPYMNPTIDRASDDVAAVRGPLDFLPADPCHWLHWSSVWWCYGTFESHYPARLRGVCFAKASFVRFWTCEATHVSDQ